MSGKESCIPPFMKKLVGWATINYSSLPLEHKPGLHLKNIHMIALVFFMLLMGEVFGFVLEVSSESL